MLRDCFSRKL